jgi:hypothetical protein
MDGPPPIGVVSTPVKAGYRAVGILSMEGEAPAEKRRRTDDKKRSSVLQERPFGTTVKALNQAVGILSSSPGWMTECSSTSLSGLASMIFGYNAPLPRNCAAIFQRESPATTV